VSSFALTARVPLGTHPLLRLAHRHQWLGDLLAFTDPRVPAAARGRSAARFVVAAVAIALFGSAVTHTGRTAAVRYQVDTIVAERPGPSGPRDPAALLPPDTDQLVRIGDRLVTGPGAKPAAAADAAIVSPSPADAPAPPGRRMPLPTGKGMWTWEVERTDGGNPEAIVARAKAADLTHIYVRTGSSWQGFHGADFLNRILPAAHAAGLRVYGWDFPKLADPGADVARAVAAINHTAPGGHRIDGFSPDIETPSEGTVLTEAGVRAYSEGLRRAVGPDYPLIVTVPRPSPQKIAQFNYGLVLEQYDAVAPMVYWLNRQPGSDVIASIQYLSQFGKPILPVGQAYDGAPEGGRPGVPSPAELEAFMNAAEDHGAAAVSFWSWQHADANAWSAVAASKHFSVRPAQPESMRPGQIAGLQHLLTGLGYPVPASGAWTPETDKALRSFQTDAKVKPSGQVDAVTRDLLLAPAAPPRRVPI
jgi:hypothetical protein